MSAIAAAALTPIGRAMAADAATIDAGELARYAEEGIYPEYQSQGFFVVRQGKRVFAQSAVCTHRGCKLSPSQDGFGCKCHGSRFSVDGKVLRAPAKTDLPRYAVAQSDSGHLLVDLSRRFASGDFEREGAYVPGV